jgi:LPXTG-motif cell wall-anchored protein
MAAPAFVAVEVVGVAPAQASVAAPSVELPDPGDFIDPETGEFDLDAYLAALGAALQNPGGGEEALPRTGSSTVDLVAFAGGLLLLGGAAVATSRREKTAHAT